MPALLCAASLVLGPAALAQTDAEKTKAKIHYKTGKKAFDAADYATALAEYNKAYSLLPLPGLLFNIGQCYRNLGSHQEAINSFNLYLEESPNARNRPAVEKLIGELKKEIAAAGPVDKPDPQGTDPADKVDVPGEDGSDDPLTGGPGDKPDEVDPDGGPEVVAVNPIPPPPKKDRATSSPFYKKWWFWTIVGAAVAGGAATGIYFGTQSSGAGIPGSSLGTLDYSR